MTVLAYVSNLEHENRQMRDLLIEVAIDIRSGQFAPNDISKKILDELLRIRGEK